MTSLEKLILMANQIAANQQHEPDPVAATKNHMSLYWDPRMKEMIRQHATHGGAGLSETALAALRSVIVT